MQGKTVYPSEPDCKLIKLFDEEHETYDHFWNGTAVLGSAPLMTRSEIFNRAMETYADNVYCNSLNHDLNRSVLWIVDYLTRYGMDEIEALKIGLLLADESLQALKAKTDQMLEQNRLYLPHLQWKEADIVEIAELII